MLKNITDSKGGFYFIYTLLDVRVELPINITPTLRLEKAGDEQINFIYKLLKNRDCYEFDRIKEDINLNSYRYKLEEIPREKWRYYIISFSGANFIVNQFFKIADIVFPHLNSFINFYTVEEFGKGELCGYGHNIGKLSECNNKIIDNNIPQIFDQKSLENLQCLFEKYNNLDKNKYEGILRAIDFNINLQKATNLPNHLHILGIFAIIEMLLTHKPNNKEIGDSLMHQIKTKIAFITPRLNTPLKYCLFPFNNKTDKIWEALYEYRSCIAHGNRIDFTEGKLQILKNADTAFEFLNDAARVLLAHAISEPEVINGLKPI